MFFNHYRTTCSGIPTRRKKSGAKINKMDKATSKTRPHFILHNRSESYKESAKACFADAHSHCPLPPRLFRNINTEHFVGGLHSLRDSSPSRTWYLPTFTTTPCGHLLGRKLYFLSELFPAPFPIPESSVILLCPIALSVHNLSSIWQHLE